MIAKRRKIDLVTVTVDDLGLEGPATRWQIYNRGRLLGLNLCPDEVGPKLRLDYGNQPRGEKLFIAMAPFTDAEGDLFIYRVSCDSNKNRWLSGSIGNANRIWAASATWVFTRLNNTSV